MKAVVPRGFLKYTVPYHVRLVIFKIIYDPCVVLWRGKLSTVGVALCWHFLQITQLMARENSACR